MHLIQILLPMPRAADAPGLYRQIRDELTDQFGGVTAFTGAPAEGLWEEKPGRVERDTVILVEVMTEELDVPWWSLYRRSLERRLGQKEILIRVLSVRTI